jgi:hypothetical protein
MVCRARAKFGSGLVEPPRKFRLESKPLSAMPARIAIQLSPCGPNGRLAAATSWQYALVSGRNSFRFKQLDRVAGIVNPLRQTGGMHAARKIACGHIWNFCERQGDRNRAAEH